MNPQATAGRIVHVPNDDGTPRAAIVNVDTDADGLAEELTVFAKGGPRVMRNVPYAEEPVAGCWSWMPYQKAKAETAEGNQSESAEPRPGVPEPPQGSVASKAVAAETAPEAEEA